MSAVLHVSKFTILHRVAMSSEVNKSASCGLLSKDIVHFRKANSYARGRTLTDTAYEGGTLRVRIADVYS